MNEPDQPLALDIIAQRCGTGSCPTIYTTNRGTLLVQGHSFDPAQAGKELPSGEQMVEVPIELITDYLQHHTP